jgi:hypothetical protein
LVRIVANRIGILQELHAANLCVVRAAKNLDFANPPIGRKRKPIAPATLELWKGCLEKWINPNIGDLPLSEVNNNALKALVAKMSDGGLSPKTITGNYVPVVKMVVASAVDE